MADAAIFDLTAETAMTAAHEFVTQDTSAATRAQAATFALMGGLEIDNTYDSAADHSDFTGAVGKHYIVDLSGLASVMNFTLPTTAAVGERIGLSIVGTQNTTPGEELTITAGTSDFLNGVAGGTEWSRMFILGETVIMKCVVANSEWVVEVDGRKPTTGLLNLGTNSSDGYLSSGAFTLVKFDETHHDVGGICDAANELLRIRRGGIYQLIWQMGVIGITTDDRNHQIAFKDDAGTPAFTNWGFNVHIHGGTKVFNGATILEYATSDIAATTGRIGMYYQHNDGAGRDALGDSSGADNATSMGIYEMLQAYKT